MNNWNKNQPTQYLSCVAVLDIHSGTQQRLYILLKDRREKCKEFSNPKPSYRRLKK